MVPSFTVKWFDSNTGDEIVKQPGQSDESFADQLSDRDIHQVCQCDVDKTLVSVSEVGTSEYAQCQAGHRWQQSFDGSTGWIALT